MQQRHWLLGAESLQAACQLLASASDMNRKAWILLEEIALKMHLNYFAEGSPEANNTRN